MNKSLIDRLKNNTTIFFDNKFGIFNILYRYQWYTPVSRSLPSSSIWYRKTYTCGALSGDVSDCWQYFYTHWPFKVIKHDVCDGTLSPMPRIEFIFGDFERIVHFRAHRDLLYWVYIFNRFKRRCLSKARQRLNMRIKYLSLFLVPDVMWIVEKHVCDYELGIKRECPYLEPMATKIEEEDIID